VLALGLAAWPAVAVHGPLRTTLGMVGVGAVGLLLGGLAARAGGPLAWSIGLLGVSAAAAMLAGGAPVERVAPVWGPALLLAAELAWWALDRTYLPRDPAGVARRRATLVVTMAAAAAILALLVILAGGLTGAASGLDVRVLGAAAAVMVAWTLAVLARRAGGR
jgi:hypothetical protein